MSKKTFVFLSILFCFLDGFSQHLSISSNKRYIETSAKQPFMWIGDTAWELFHRLNREEATEYLSKRAKQGFTVIQAVVLAESDGLRTPNPYGDIPLIDLSPLKPNESYFKHVDFIIDKAEELGLHIALLPTWADKVFSDRPGVGPVVFDKENAAFFGEFLGKRYQDKPVIWVLGGDRNIANSEVMDIWRAMGFGLKKGDKSNHLITYHPAGEASSSQWFQNESWIDFNMYQSGHAHRFMEVYKLAENDYSKRPVKPFLEAEPAYEDIPVQFWTFINWDSEKKVPDSVLNKDGLLVVKDHFKKGYFTDYDVRVHAYWNFLAGACGYTYGHNAVWQMFKKGGPSVIPCFTDWREALDRPGANDMQHVRTLFESRPFSKLIPDQSMILGKNPQDSSHIRAARADDGSFSLIYLPSAKPLQINTTKIKGTKTIAWWYNPRNGKALKIGEFSKSTNTSFSSPEKDRDWVLVLDSNTAKLKQL